jgi:hypothetical protein
MYGPGRDQVEERLDAVPKNVVDRVEEHQLSCSSSDGGVDAEKVILALVWSASDFAPASDVLQQPLRHWCEFDSLDGTKEPQYCAQTGDIVTR